MHYKSAVQNCSSYVYQLDCSGELISTAHQQYCYKMEILQVATFLTVSLALLSGHVHSVIVSQADENRAIARIQQLIQTLEQDRSNPPRVVNVSKHNYVV